MNKLDLDDLIEDAPSVWASHFRYRGDRRTMTSTARAMEDTHLTLQVRIDLHKDDPRLPQVARALAEALRPFNL